MKAAFPVWKGKISPVFDVAREIRIVEKEEDAKEKEATHFIKSDAPMERVSLIINEGVNELICGAISRTLYTVLTHNDIRVIPFISGNYQEVLRAWLMGRLHLPYFIMPGCRRAKMRSMIMEVETMNGEQSGQSGGSGGGGAGRGPGHRWRRRGEGAGPGGFCICTGCGHKEPHKRGVPCSQEVCPKCGAPMFRE